MVQALLFLVAWQLLLLVRHLLLEAMHLFLVANIVPGKQVSFQNFSHDLYRSTRTGR